MWLHQWQIAIQQHQDFLQVSIQLRRPAKQSWHMREQCRGVGQHVSQQHSRVGGVAGYTQSCAGLVVQKHNRIAVLKSPVQEHIHGFQKPFSKGVRVPRVLRDIVVRQLLREDIELSSLPPDVGSQGSDAHSEKLRPAPVFLRCRVLMHRREQEDEAPAGHGASSALRTPPTAPASIRSPGQRSRNGGGRNCCNGSTRAQDRDPCPADRATCRSHAGSCRIESRRHGPEPSRTA
mmetsp:Transcript_117211/g.373345  ORF Transcript_117211/g.373345 Transcript_117211/m.373345 type:complete len:234 (-) Transcript_117211:210-911(-)